jgi:hypothetical protein
MGSKRLREVCKEIEERVNGVGTLIESVDSGPEQTISCVLKDAVVFEGLLV